MCVRSLGQEDPLEKEMETHFNVIAWKIQWTEERGSLQSMRSQSQALLSDWACMYALGIFQVILALPQFPVTKEYRKWSSSLHTSSVLIWQVCSLERFRSLQDKIQLLEEAVSMHDGNVITAVSCAFCCLITAFISFWKSNQDRFFFKYLYFFIWNIVDSQSFILFIYFFWFTIF